MIQLLLTALMLFGIAIALTLTIIIVVLGVCVIKGAIDVMKKGRARHKRLSASKNNHYCETLNKNFQDKVK